jgi:hypothetical protein
MKKIKLEGKLNLKKETISKLNNQQMNDIQGGLLSIGNNCSKKNSCKRVCGHCPDAYRQ